jgi:hypothetical protein
MSVLESLKNQLRSRKQSESSSSWERYRQLIRAVHEERDIDLDSAQSILDSVGRSWSQLEDEDLPQYRKRLELQALVQQAKNADQQLRAEQSKRDSLQRELDGVTARIVPQIAASNMAIGDIELRIRMASHAQADLVRSCTDQALLERFQSTQEELSARVKDRSEAALRLSGCGVGSHQYAERTAMRLLTEWSERFRLSFGNEYTKRQRDRWQRVHEAVQQQRMNAEGLLREIDADILRLREELDDIRNRMMEP